MKQATLRNDEIGLINASGGESDFQGQVYKFVMEKHSKRAIGGDTVKQARVPKGTVAPEVQLRRSLLQLSLFPNPINKRAKLNPLNFK